MRRDRVVLLCGVLVLAGIAGGCSSAGSGGAGGSGGGGGTAGTTTTDGGGGAPVDGGDAATDTKTDTATDTGGGDTPADVKADTGTDVAGDVADTHADGPTVCTTNFGAGNPVQFAFNGGVNAGWSQFISSDLAGLANADPPFSFSLGASYTDGHSCAGALQFAVNFTGYGMPNAHGESATTEYYYSATPNGRNWTGYNNLHAWVKVLTADYQALDSIYFYLKSQGVRYQAARGMSSDLSNGGWHQLVIDLTVPPSGLYAGVTINDIQQIGFEVLLNMAPPAGAPATPSQVILLVDDIWLEAAPPADGGTDGGDASTDAVSGG